jgi:hypothetical protein
LDQPFGGTADAQLDALVLELLRGGVLAPRLENLVHGEAARIARWSFAGGADMPVGTC